MVPYLAVRVFLFRARAVEELLLIVFLPHFITSCFSSRKVLLLCLLEYLLLLLLCLCTS
jgi:hypothetical protein